MGRPLRVSTPTTKAFAERLSDLVQAKKNEGLSHDEISREIGVSSGVLSEWMSDNKTASIENLSKLSRYFSVTSDYLLGLSEAKTADKNVQIACKTTGLSADAINALKFDKGKKKERDIFLIEDFLMPKYRCFLSKLKSMNSAMLMRCAFLLGCARENVSVSRGRRWTLRKVGSPSASSSRKLKAVMSNIILRILPKAGSCVPLSRPRFALIISATKSADRRKTSSRPVSCGTTNGTLSLRMG